MLNMAQSLADPNMGCPLSQPPESAQTAAALGGWWLSWSAGDGVV